MNKRKLLTKIQNNNKNVLYNDFATIIKSYGFSRTRSEGSHEIYRHKNVADIVNIQNDNGQAKPYQVKQFLFLIEKYDLKLEDDNNV